jgi:DNA (cytosine-5)-methyltransferase 1
MRKLNLTTKQAISYKLTRLQAGGTPRVLDLFAGCGGLSLGFKTAGFDIAAAIEIDPDASRSHGINFHNGREEHCKARDIITTHPEDLVRELGLGTINEAVDVIVGGPPCQAFARVGRPKLREIDAHPQAFKHDPRAQLYLEYLRYVEAFQPLAVLVENVPDVLNHGGQNIAEEIGEVLESKGYICRYTLLHAAFYGVPQMRQRMFLIAYRRELTDQVIFPSPTHWVDVPTGYDGSRAVALKLLKKGEFFGNTHNYVEPPEAAAGLIPAITVEQAISDLPPVYARELLKSGELRRGARRFDKPIPYGRRSNYSTYAQLMRTWPGFEAPESLMDHVIRYLPRDYDLFARLNPGDQYPEAWRHAHSMLAERISQLQSEGINIIEGTSEYENLKNQIVPPYDVNKFPNKWRKMEADKPARTLMAHLGKDGYSHIHYDSVQARTISVREAARLQSFPDGFVFSGTMNPAFRQIGNSVPPLMARALAITIIQQLQKGVTKSETKTRIEAASCV